MAEDDQNALDILGKLPSRQRDHLRSVSLKSGVVRTDTTESFESSGSNEPSISDSASTSVEPTDKSSIRHRSGHKEDKFKHPKRRIRYRNLIEGHRTTIFDSEEWHTSIFFGFSVLFWVILGLITVRTLVVNIFTEGSLLKDNVIRTLRQDFIKVAITDGIMYAGMFVTYFLQRLVQKNRLNWETQGWIIQHLWQVIFLNTFIFVARYFSFPWIARIFLLLHSLTMLMKQHSYSMYCGHLHKITKELETVKKLEHTVTNSETMKQIKERIDFCQDELNYQSKTKRYPENMTLQNYALFTLFPVLVYQLEYPRCTHIRWGVVAKKLLATFGLFFLLIIWSEQHIYPVYERCVQLRSLPLNARFKEYPIILADLIPPFIVAYLVTFYLVWDAILSAIAELTMFGERTFYRDWWNTVHWDKFARDWNVPVHQFLYRHVYHSSISSLQVSKFTATLITFILSSVVHELAMYVIFGKMRGYLFCFQLFQMPLEMLSKLSFFTRNPALGIAFFWFGICVGPSILTSLYLTF